MKSLIEFYKEKQLEHYKFMMQMHGYSERENTVQLPH
jgi:hypothetical protein